MNIKTNLANKANYGGKRALNSIKYIVIHYTANDGDTDENNGRYFHNNVTYTSAHYFVDSDSATHTVPDDYNAYAVGKDYKKKGETNLFGIVTNANSLSIELCDDVKNGVIYPSQATINNAIELTKMLMAKYNIPAKNVVRHWDVCSKKCPAYWVDDTKWKAEFHNKLSAKNVDIKYQAHIQNKGWLPVVSVDDNDFAGLTGKALRMEALKIWADGINLKYRGHIQNIGWQDYVASGQLCGTEGKALRMEAVQIDADIPLKYRVHIQNLGWSDWYTNGQIAGTTGKSLRLEAIEIRRA